MQAHNQQPIWYCCPCAHHAGTQPAASMVLLSLCTLHAHSPQTVEHCCPCAHHTGTQPAASMVLPSLCTTCRLITSSQHGTAVPVHNMQAHNQQPARYCCPCAHHTAAAEVQIHPVLTSTLWTPAVLSLGREPPVPTEEEVGWIPELVWMQLAASHQLTVRIINPFNVLCTADSPTRTSQAIGWSCTVHVMSHQPLTTEIQIQPQDHQCGICGGQIGSQTPSVTTLCNRHDWQYHTGTSFRKAWQTLKIVFLSFHYFTEL